MRNIPTINVYVSPEDTLDDMVEKAMEEIRKLIHSGDYPLEVQAKWEAPKTWPKQ